MTGTVTDDPPTNLASRTHAVCGPSLLIHDAQYTAEEYARTRGWGHSTVHDALAFARRAESEHVALFTTIPPTKTRVST